MYFWKVTAIMEKGNETLNGTSDICNKKNKHRIKKLLWVLFTSIGVFVLVLIDQVSKTMAIKNLKNNDSITVIKGFFSLTYVENKGAAWGVLSGRISILVIVTIILIPLFIFGMIKLYKNKELLDISKLKAVSILHIDIILLLSGAIGNIIDRIVNGYVVDLFQFTFIDFPVFNVADCYITIGAAIFIIIYLFILKDEDISILLKGKNALKAVSEDKINDEISDKL